MNAPVPAGAAPDPADREDMVAVEIDGRRDELRRRLDDLLTRSFYSGAGYVFESDPFVVADDADLLGKMTVIREQDRRHAHVLAALIAARGGVPAPEVFPFWDLDLNYLTVPTISRFVVDALVEEIALYDALLARWPADDDEGRKALRVVRDEKARQVADLRPAVEAALAREAEAYRTAAAAVKKVRDARLAKRKAAAEAARKAKAAARPGAGGAPPQAVAGAAAAPAPAAAIGDPNEPGISKKEKGRRALLRIRAKHGLPLSRLAGGAAAAAPSSAPTAAAAARVAPAPPTPPAAAAASGGALLDPNEPGIPPKEKARRQMLKLRAAAGGAPAAVAPASSAAPAPAAAPPASAPAPVPPAPAAEALPADLGDPDEPGIPPKEKARRQMARIRAKRG